eukprot:scaffold26726_cov53-Phaeocystis_antarctica.AAC.2
MIPRLRIACSMPRRAQQQQQPAQQGIGAAASRQKRGGQDDSRDDESGGSAGSGGSGGTNDDNVTSAVVAPKKKGKNKGGKKARVGRQASGVHWTESGVARGGPGGDADELCAMFDESSGLSVRSFLPEYGLGHGPVVPFPAYALRVRRALVSNSIMKI